MKATPTTLCCQHWLPGQKNDLLLLRLILKEFQFLPVQTVLLVLYKPVMLEAFYGPDSPRLKESVRISLSPLNTEEGLRQLTNLKKILLEINLMAFEKPLNYKTAATTIHLAQLSKRFTLKDNTFFETKLETSN